MALLTKKDRIFVAGHTGLVGGAIVETLEAKGYTHFILRTHKELDLSDQQKVREFFKKERPDVVFLAAAKVGGIGANDQYRADFIRENLEIQTNVIHAAHEAKTHRFVFLGSSCVYPKETQQPIKESSLLSGPLEYTNRSYALAKIAGLEQIDSLRKQYNLDYFSVMPTNLYGPKDRFHPENSHVLPALLRRFWEAKEKGDRSVTVWGSGKPKRELMYALDCADAIIFLAEKFSKSDLDDSFIGKAGWSHVNVGSGEEISIQDLARLITETVGYRGKIEYDSTKPDGTVRKFIDSAILQRLGWKPKTDLKAGIKKTFDWFQKNYPQISDSPSKNKI